MPLKDLTADELDALIAEAQAARAAAPAESERVAKTFDEALASGDIGDLAQAVDAAAALQGALSTTQLTAVVKVLLAQAQA